MMQKNTSYKQHSNWEHML